MSQNVHTRCKITQKSRVLKKMWASGFYSFKKISEECLSALVTHMLVTEVHHPRCLCLESTVNSDMLSFHVDRNIILHAPYNCHDCIFRTNMDAN